LSGRTSGFATTVAASVSVMSLHPSRWVVPRWGGMARSPYRGGPSGLASPAPEASPRTNLGKRPYPRSKPPFNHRCWTLRPGTDAAICPRSLGDFRMLTSFARRGQPAEAQSKLDAINRSQAVIEFTLEGTILWANENFLSVMGYGLDEIVGKHHSLFVAPDHAASEAYSAFWKSLAQGRFQVDEFQRIAKGGREIWIQGSYNPILDKAGKPVRIVKFATDIT